MESCLVVFKDLLDNYSLYTGVIQNEGFKSYEFFWFY